MKNSGDIRKMMDSIMDMMAESGEPRARTMQVKHRIDKKMQEAMFDSNKSDEELEQLVSIFEQFEKCIDDFIKGE